MAAQRNGFTGCGWQHRVNSTVGVRAPRLGVVRKPQSRKRIVMLAWRSNKSWRSLFRSADQRRDGLFRMERFVFYAVRSSALLTCGVLTLPRSRTNHRVRNGGHPIVSVENGALCPRFRCGDRPPHKQPLQNIQKSPARRAAVIAASRQRGYAPRAVTGGVTLWA